MAVEIRITHARSGQAHAHHGVRAVAEAIPNAPIPSRELTTECFVYSRAKNRRTSANTLRNIAGVSTPVLVL
jgi:catalase